MGILAATLLQKSHRVLNCVSSSWANPSALMLNSLPDDSGGTPVSLAPVSFSALGSPVAKKEAKAPV